MHTDTKVRKSVVRYSINLEALPLRRKSNMRFGLATVASTEKARRHEACAHVAHAEKRMPLVPGRCYCDAARPTAVAMMPKMTIAIATFPHDHSRLPLTFLSLVSRAIRCLSQWSTMSVTCSTVHRRGASVQGVDGGEGDEGGGDVRGEGGCAMGAKEARRAFGPMAGEAGRWAQ